MADHANTPVRIEDWFTLAHTSGGGMIPMPFVKEVFLLESEVVGTGFVDGIERKTAGIAPGDVLELRREPQNRHDELAIQVLNGDREKIGFVPRKVNPILARLMDAGKSLYAKVREVRGGGEWPRIEIDICMRDL